MSKVSLVLLLVIILAAFGLYSYETHPADNPGTTSTAPESTSIPTAVLATHLDTPWGLAFLPDGSLLVTERPGRVRSIDATGHLDNQPVATLTTAKEIGEGGLLGIAVHPDFSKNHYVYLYYTYRSEGDETLNRVVRMTFNNHQLSDEITIIDQIPGASNHNGGRLKFGPDRFLYVTTGDASEPSRAQNLDSLAGKILRVTDAGQPAPGNPFQTLVYSYGHRNPQGLAWDSQGNLWATEHGRSGVVSGLDELNLIKPGQNYGWPTIQGNEVKMGMVTSLLNSGSTTWAPAGAAYVGGAIFFGGLRGQTLYQATLNGEGTPSLHNHFSSIYGRIRDVVLGPDNQLYITTSNQDGRGRPANDDDKVIRVDPKELMKS